MCRGRFSLHNRDGTGREYPLVAATITVGEDAGEWWLTVQAQTTPPDWIVPQDGDIPEYPAIDASVRIAGPDPAAWVGREFRLPDERDPHSGCYPAWLYTTGGYDALRECVVSIGERNDDRFGVRVGARGSASDCLVSISGEFALAISNAPDAEQRRCT
jgi:hypothetical protein